MKISAVIITFNEEKKIGNAIRSVDWADEVVVVDSGSTDLTCEIAHELGARVIVRPWSGFSRQKQFAAEQALYDRIFSLDADEVVPAVLRESILKVKALDDATAADGYRLSRQAYYAGQPVRHCGWYPDWQLRFYDRRKGRWNGRIVHETITMDDGARVETLAGDLAHYTLDSVGEHHRLIGERYAPLAARHMFDTGRRTSPIKIATAAPLTFLFIYVLKAGFLDGLTGFKIAFLSAHHDFLKHSILYELQTLSDTDN